MKLLRERIEKLRSLPGRVTPSVGNWVLHYLDQHGHLPDGWEMVFGKPHFTGEKRSKKPLARTQVVPALQAESATISANVNPEVRDVNPIPVPKTGGTSQRSFHRAFRANLTSGDRTKTHHEVMKPHQACGEVYSPQCRDQEWQLPTWIGGTDWVKRPLYRHDPPDVRQTFAQDKLKLSPPDKPMPPGPPGFVPPNDQIPDNPRDVATADLAAAAFSPVADSIGEAIGYRLDDPIGLISAASSAALKKARELRTQWMRLSGSSAVSQSKRPASLDVPLPPRRRRLLSLNSTPDPDAIFAVRHKPGTPAYDAALYKQAVELRRLVGKPFYIVDYDGRRFVTSRPQSHGKILHVVEATTSASFPTQTSSGTTFYGRRGLAVIEKERKARQKRQATSDCKGYDPKCRDKEWEVPVPTGGVNLSVVRR